MAIAIAVEDVITEIAIAMKILINIHVTQINGYNIHKLICPQTFQCFIAFRAVCFYTYWRLYGIVNH